MGVFTVAIFDLIFDFIFQKVRWKMELENEMENDQKNDKGVHFWHVSNFHPIFIFGISSCWRVL